MGPWVGVPGLCGLAPFGAGSGGWAGGPGFPSLFGDVSRRWGLGVPGWPWSAVVVVCRRRRSLVVVVVPSAAFCQRLEAGASDGNPPEGVKDDPAKRQEAKGDVERVCGSA